MRRITDKEEEEIIREIESDPDIDKKWSQPIKGHVVEIKYIGSTDSIGEKRPRTTPAGIGV